MVWTRRAPSVLERATDTLPQTTTESLFRIAGGKILLLQIAGEVTTAIQNQANNTKLIFNPSGTGANTDLCAVLDVANAAVNDLFTITGTLATAMKQTAAGLCVPANALAAPGLILNAGDIILSCAASNTGSVKWTIVYQIIDLTATVVVV